MSMSACHHSPPTPKPSSQHHMPSSPSIDPPLLISCHCTSSSSDHRGEPKSHHRRRPNTSRGPPPRSCCLGERFKNPFVSICAPSPYHANHYINLIIMFAACRFNHFLSPASGCLHRHRTSSLMSLGLIALHRSIPSPIPTF